MYNYNYVVVRHDGRKGTMKNNILRVLSFAMIAIFTFAFMGIATTAEEFDIPVIEEVTEEELEEFLEEEEIEIYEGEGTPAETDYFQVLDASGNHVGFYEDTIEESVVTKTALEKAFSNVRAGYTVKLLKNYTFDKTKATPGNVTIRFPNVQFYIDGSDGNGGKYSITDEFDRRTYGTLNNLTGNKHDNVAAFTLQGSTDVTITNVLFASTAESDMAGHTNGYFSVADGTVRFQNVAFQNCFGWNGGIIWAGSKNGLVTMNNVTVSKCHARNHGTIAVYEATVAELTNVTIENGTGSIAIGIGTNGGKGQVTISNSTIRNCASGITVGKEGSATNQAILNIGNNVTIEGSKGTGLYVCANIKNVFLNGTGFNLNNNLKGMVIEKGALVNINSNITATGNDIGIDAKAGAVINLNSPVNITGNTTKQINLGGEDIIIFGAGFSGDIYANIEGIWIGHLADGVSTPNGNVYYGSDKTSYKAAFYGTLLGDGKSSDGNYTIKDTDFGDDLSSRAVVFNYPVYRRSGNEEVGYTRRGYSSVLSAYAAGNSGDTIYLLADNLTDEEGVGMNGTASVGGQTVLSHFNFIKSITLDGNGHEIKKLNNIKSYLFAVYAKKHFTVKNLVYNGNGLGSLAYINTNGGGGTISVENSVIYNGGRGTGGALYGYITNAADESTAVINVTDTTIASCTATNGGAINTGLHCTVNLKNVEITGCSTTGTGVGGAIYVTAGSKLNLAGKINITENTNPSGKENNVYLAGTNQITITEALTSGSSIGISMDQSGATFGSPAADVTVDKTMFFADGAVLRDYTGVGEYTERRIHAAFYPETVGDGKLNGTAAINTTVLDTRKASRGANELVLHWPYLVEKDNKLYGYKNINTAIANGNTKNAVIYLQKDITVEHLVGKAVATNGEQAGVREYIEFTMTGASSNYAHTDLGGYVTLDGNGHVMDVDNKNDSAIFSIQWGNRSLTLNNFIYDGQKPFAIIHKGVAEGNEVINVNNSYMKNPKDYWIFTVGKGGTINITDSTLDGSVEMYGVAATDSAAAFISKFTLSGNTSVNGIGSIKIADAYSVGYINGNYTGNSAISGDISKLNPGENFTALKTAKSITKVGTSGATFAYYDAATGKFGWTAADITLATDSGKYADGTGLIRFMTTFTKAPINAVENYGTYVIGESVFEGNPEAIEKFGKFENAPTKDGQAYIVDVINIQPDNMNEDITAISFVKIKGITTPIYSYFGTVNFNTAAANGVVKDLGEKA